MSIENALNPRANALNFLRLLFAALVIISHAAPIGGFGSDPNVHGWKLGTAAVGCFFVVSGYLITRSRDRSVLSKYLWARFLRIYPGLWLAALMTAFVITPLISLRNGGWSLGAALSYLPYTMTMVEGPNEVGHTTSGNPVEAINGSLWTLPYEVACYIGVAVLVAVPAIWKHKIVTVLMWSGCTAVAFAVYWGEPNAHGALANASYLGTFFAAGMVLYRYRAEVKFTPLLVITAFAALVAVAVSGFGTSLSSMPVAYLVLYLGSALGGVFRKIGSKNDLSYGMYVYAFPLQQLVYTYGGADRGFWFFVGLCLVVPIPFAAISWKFVEEPAMKLRKLIGDAPKKDPQLPSRAGRKLA